MQKTRQGWLEEMHCPMCCPARDGLRSKEGKGLVSWVFQAPALQKESSLNVEKRRRQGFWENMKKRCWPIPDRETHHGKARFGLVEVRANGTRRRPCCDERSDRENIHVQCKTKERTTELTKVDIEAKPSEPRQTRKRYYKKSDARQEASVEHRAYTQIHGQI